MMGRSGDESVEVLAAEILDKAIKHARRYQEYKDLPKQTYNLVRSHLEKIFEEGNLYGTSQKRLINKLGEAISKVANLDADKNSFKSNASLIVNSAFMEAKLKSRVLRRSVRSARSRWNTLRSVVLSKKLHDEMAEAKEDGAESTSDLKRNRFAIAALLKADSALAGVGAPKFHDFAGVSEKMKESGTMNPLRRVTRKERRLRNSEIESLDAVEEKLMETGGTKNPLAKDGARRMLSGSAESAAAGGVELSTRLKQILRAFKCNKFHMPVVRHKKKGRGF